jgi:2-oxo-4-hydroxy-4-carboxy--5-ureidoimidazoline (OHCU) decarboxylase
VVVAHRRGSSRSVRRAPQDRRAKSTTANAQTLADLTEAQRQYESQYGFIFIVCASGRSADAMLADVRARLASSREVELRTAAEEQAKITRLRLGKLLWELST